MAGCDQELCPHWTGDGWVCACVALGIERSGPCIGNDPTCPCQDGDPCHYRAYGDSPGWPIPGDGEQG